MYKIETRSAVTGNTWTDEVGDANEFESEGQAEATIESLREIGPDWAEAEYRVVGA